MIVVMRKDSTEKEIEGILERLSQLGLQGHISTGIERTVIGVVGQTYAGAERYAGASARRR